MSSPPIPSDRSWPLKVSTSSDDEEGEEEGRRTYKLIDLVARFKFVDLGEQRRVAFKLKVAEELEKQHLITKPISLLHWDDDGEKEEEEVGKDTFVWSGREAYSDP